MDNFLKYCLKTQFKEKFIVVIEYILFVLEFVNGICMKIYNFDMKIGLV